MLKLAHQKDLSQAPLRRFVRATLLLASPDALARRGIGVIHGEVVGHGPRAEGVRRVVGLPAAPRPRCELKNDSTHDKPSHNTIKTSTVKASAIK